MGIPNPLITSPLITSFAPAPTGYLHLGHVLNAIYVWDLARASGPGARVLLRIEDHDRARSRPEFETALLEDLAWLGFAADGELTRQSERGALYERALDELRARGLTYGCECSRTEIGSGWYPGTCRDKRLRESAGLGIRLRLEPGGRAVRRPPAWAAGAAALRTMRRSARPRSTRQLGLSVRGRRR